MPFCCYPSINPIADKEASQVKINGSDMFGYARTGAVDSLFGGQVSIQMRYFSAEAGLEVMQ